MNNIFKRCFSILTAGILFIITAKTLRYILIDDTKSYTRVMLHELYTSEKNIDAAVIGSSHAYRSFVPDILDDHFGIYTFNAGSSGQGMDGSYAMVREVSAHHDLKELYLEMYYGVAEGAEHQERTEMISTHILSDYMRPSLRKISFLCDATPREQWIDGFLVARRNWKKLFDLKYIKNLVGKKHTYSYKNYSLDRGGSAEYYVGRGFVANEITAESSGIWNGMAFGTIEKAVHLTEQNDWYRSLMKIIDYCKKKKIKLTFVIAPEPEWTIVGKQNYDSYHMFIQRIADENDIEFLDFNLCKNEYFNSGDYKLFKDEDHLNLEGAKCFSTIFSQVCMGKISKDKVLYESLNDKLKDEEPFIYGLAGPYLNEELNVNEAYIISNRDEYFEYRIEAESSDNRVRVIQDYCVNSSFSLPVNEHGKLRIYCRPKGSSVDEKMIDTEY